MTLRYVITSTDLCLWLLADYLRVKIEAEDMEAQEVKGRLVSVEPTQKKRVIGTVKRNHLGLMGIDGYIYVDKRAFDAGWSPRPGDTVCALVVESAQEKFTWRAVSVSPSNFGNYTNAAPNE